MTRDKDDPIAMEKIVASVDICSSSQILEDLMMRSKVTKWRDLLIGLKDHIMQESPKVLANPYKFTGDGWIILFEIPTPGADIIRFLQAMNEFYLELFSNDVSGTIDKKPKSLGLTFGLDEGHLVQMEMRGQNTSDVL